MVKNGWNTDRMMWMAKKFKWVVHMYEFNDTQFRYFFNDILKNVRAFLPSPIPLPPKSRLPFPVPAAISNPPPMATAGGDADSPPQPLPADLDDNGFPSLPSPTAAGGSSSGFAEDFYRSGTDWSSLRGPPPWRPPEGRPGVKAKEKEGASLVQSSLFRAWGIERPPREGGGAGHSSPVQKSLFQAWGIERPKREGFGAGDPSPSPSHSGSWSGRKRQRGGPGEAAPAALNPRTCPFYKKIPGNGHAVIWLDTCLW
jgi:DNA cross-link repair 1A protein